MRPIVWEIVIAIDGYTPLGTLLHTRYLGNTYYQVHMLDVITIITMLLCCCSAAANLHCCWRRYYSCTYRVGKQICTYHAAAGLSVAEQR